MAKLKKTVRAKPAAAKTSAADLQARAEHLSRSLVESAQQIWMAGVGAFTRAQGEGSKLFDALVAEGMNIEKTTRKLASGKVDAVRDAMEDRVGAVRGRASDTWDRLEKVFEDRVQRALNRLGVPGREDLAELSARVDALAGKPRAAKSASAGRSRASAPAKRAARKPAAKPAAKTAGRGNGKTPAKSAAKSTAKAARKPAARKSLPKAARPVAPQS